MTIESSIRYRWYLHFYIFGNLCLNTIYIPSSIFHIHIYVFNIEKRSFSFPKSSRDFCSPIFLARKIPFPPDIPPISRNSLKEKYPGPFLHWMRGISQKIILGRGILSMVVSIRRRFDVEAFSLPPLLSGYSISSTTASLAVVDLSERATRISCA